MKRSSASSAIALLVGQAEMIFIIAIIAREAELPQVGDFMVAYTLSLLLGGLIDFGSSQRMTRDLAREHVAAVNYRRWLLNRTALQVVPVAVACLIAAHAVVHIPGFVAAGVMAQALTYTISQGVAARAQIVRGVPVTLWAVSAGNAVALVIIAAAGSWRFWPAVSIAIPLSWLVSAAICHQLSRAPGDFRPFLGGFSNPWRGSRSFGMHGVLAQAFGLNVALVAWLSGPNEAALLGAVNRWTQPIALIAFAAAQTAFPAMSAAMSAHGALDELTHHAAILWLGLLGALGLLIIAPVAIGVILGDDYAGATGTLRLLVLGAIPVLIAQPLASLLQARGEETFVAWATGVATAIALGAVAACAESLGASSAGVGTLFLSVGLSITYAKRVRSVLARERVSV